MLNVLLGQSDMIRFCAIWRMRPIMYNCMSMRTAFLVKKALCYPWERLDYIHNSQILRSVSVAAKMLTELICFEPKICICNVNGIRKKGFSADIPTDLSLNWKLIFLVARFCICNWRLISPRKNVCP